jgi:hypothetical protein
MQAIDRTHRIGQFKPIFATRFIIENSIEERILKLQEKKKLVFDGTVGGTRYVCVKCMYVCIILDPTNLPRPSARRV